MKNTLLKTKNILNKYNITANKRYGQNFLIDDNILQEIILASNISENDLIIEIGPGLGNLTEYILENAGYSLLVEIDKNMIEILNDRFRNKNNYKLINEDILKINIDEYVKNIELEQNKKFNKIKVVANLPYYITTPIIFKLLDDKSKIDEIIVMVQKEVADRMVAKKKTKDYGILTLMVEYLSDANVIVNVPNTSFIPAPNVTSSVIRLVKNKKYKVKDEKILYDLIHMSFAKRRKKMINSLQMSNFMNKEKNELESIFEACNISLNTRAEELSIAEYIKIADKIVNI